MKASITVYVGTILAAVLPAALVACQAPVVEDSASGDSAFRSPSEIMNPKFEPYVTAALAEKCPPGKPFPEAARCQAIERMNLHYSLVASEGFGLYYGTQSSVTPPSGLNHETLASDCISWVLEVTKAGFVSAGQPSAASKITIKNGSGTTLLRSLQNNGWTMIYFNPDTDNPWDGKSDWNYNFKKAKNGKGYYSDGPTRIDGLIVNYAPNPAAPASGELTPVSADGQAAMERLKRIPYYVGVVEGGIHTFVGFDGNVSEFHWASNGTEGPEEEGAIQVTPLESWFHDEGDRRHGWSDGVVAIPPGLWAATAN